MAADFGLETPVEDPVYKVIYNSRDITADITPYVTHLTYTDHEHGQSDEVEITAEDREHRWKSAWYPDVSAWLEVEIGYADGRRLRCGSFELDEIEFDGVPDTVRIKALATIITPKLRTHRSAGYDGKTLKGIVEEVAARNGLTVRGDIEPIALDRVTQNHEKDLPFLVRLAEDFGYAFSARGKFLDFHRVADLEAAAPALTYRRLDLKHFTLREKAEATYPEARVSYLDPDLKKLIQDRDDRDGIKTGDTHALLKRAKERGIAKKKAESHLHLKDKRQIAGSITVVGDTRLVAGINLVLQGLYRLDGKYHVTDSSHRLDRQGGYESEAELYRVSA
ncbi:MAG TPA: Cro/Cl family transcriptional regulator [bacterium]|nr:Cro/Cl family transcriptional regulator [bacterium]